MPDLCKGVRRSIVDSGVSMPATCSNTAVRGSKVLRNWIRSRNVVKYFPCPFTLPAWLRFTRCLLNGWHGVPSMPRSISSCPLHEQQPSWILHPKQLPPWILQAKPSTWSSKVLKKCFTLAGKFCVIISKLEAFGSEQLMISVLKPRICRAQD